MTSRQQYERAIREALNKTLDETAELEEEVQTLYKIYPRQLVDSGWTDTYFDGSFGPMYYFEVWTDPADGRVGDAHAVFEEQTRKIDRREMKKVWGTPHTCGRRKCYWHD